MEKRNNFVNMKVRAKNPTWLVAFVSTVVTAIYQILALFDIVPPITHDQVMELLGVVITILAALGILVDPTTKGIRDSDRALGYDEPGGGVEEQL